MSSFGNIKVEVVIGQNSTADRGNSYRPLPDSQFINYLGNQTMDRSMPTPGTVMGGDITQALRPLVVYFEMLVFPGDW